MRVNRVLALLLVLLLNAANVRVVNASASSVPSSSGALSKASSSVSLHPPGHCSASPQRDGAAVKWSRVPGAKSYQVWRKARSEKYILIQSTSKTAIVDKSVEKGQRYYYRISAAASSAGHAAASRKSKAAAMDFYPLNAHVICVDTGHGNKRTLPNIPLAPGSKNSLRRHRRYRQPR